MIFQQVEIIKAGSNSPSRGVYTGTPTSLGHAFMSISIAGAQTVFNSGVQELSVTHEGWARRTEKTNQIRVNDVIVYGDKNLRVTEVHDEGSVDSRWLKFLLDEQTIKEVR